MKMNVVYDYMPHPKAYKYTVTGVYYRVSINIWTLFNFRVHITWLCGHCVQIYPVAIQPYALYSVY